MLLTDLVRESLGSVLREARRTAPMAAGIVWGVASVFVLVAVGRGFEATQREQLAAFGDSFVLLRLNRASQTRTGVQGGGFVRLDSDDIEAVRIGSPAVEEISPKANHFGARVFRGGNIVGWSVAIGVEPRYSDIVHVAIGRGRWIDQNDLDQELPVCVLGWGAREDLFGDEPCLGEEVQLIFTRRAGEETIFRRLTVVGTLADEELAGDDVYTSHRNVIFLPFTTWERFSPRDFQFFVMRPREDYGMDAALANVRAVLANRHGFDPEEKNTLVSYFDGFERKAQIDSVFGGLEKFLGAVGVLILLLGAIGVANVVLMSVTARTFEFGLRRALGCGRRWIFAQVFLEAAVVCLTSGTLGFLLGAFGISMAGFVDLPEGFAPPRAEWAAAWLPLVLLFAVSLGAAAWPAARASRMSPALALRGGGL